MTEKTCWQEFFEGHAPIYDDNCFTKNTVHEVDFLLKELGLEPGATILDVGCGTGRHSVELARRGYVVTGLDLSDAMLAEAGKHAQAAGVKVEWLQADATDFALRTRYDAAICLCEGAFGLLSQSDDPVEQPQKILTNISRSLKPGAKALLTVLSAARLLRKYQDTDVVEGRFDPATLTESHAMPPREGLPAVTLRERAFVPTEIRLLCRLAGLEVLNIWGGTAGNWGRRPIKLDEFEFMFVVRK
jgi:ubiquinone/menaquinone biosynthesis C-methylase UbiE